MTTSGTTSAVRVDRILSLIDECLAEVDGPLRAIEGGGAAPYAPGDRRPHLTVVGGGDGRRAPQTASMSAPRPLSLPTMSS